MLGKQRRVMCLVESRKKKHLLQLNSLSFCLLACSTCLPTCQVVNPLACQLVRLCLFICLPVCLPTCLPACLPMPVCPSACLLAYLPANLCFSAPLPAILCLSVPLPACLLAVTTRTDGLPVMFACSCISGDDMAYNWSAAATEVCLCSAKLFCLHHREHNSRRGGASWEKVDLQRIGKH